MANFVLVHGAWHGGWCWKRVRRQLQDQGHDVFTPTLTGLGERRHLLSREVSLSTHVDDVTNLIRWEDLTDIVLCGHSSSGLVVTGVADRLADRVAALVYLEAYVPHDGQTVFDLSPPELAAMLKEQARLVGDGWQVPPFTAELMNVNAADRAWVDAQCTPQPMATFEQGLRLTGEVDRVAHKSFIFAGDFEQTMFRVFYDHAKAQGWRTSEIAAGHDVMLDAPTALTRELLASAEQAGLLPARG